MLDKKRVGFCYGHTYVGAAIIVPSTSCKRARQPRLPSDQQSGLLYLTVPWRCLELVHERARILEYEDESLYGASIEIIEEVEELAFDHLSDDHVTPPFHSKAAGVIDLWRLRGRQDDPYGRGFSFILLESHLALYRGILKCVASGGRPRSLMSQFGSASRLHGASGSGKSHAMLYILFRELARGRGCIVLRRSGRPRLLFWLKSVEQPEAVDKKTGLKAATGNLIQISGFETTGGALHANCLTQDCGEPEYIDWGPVPLTTTGLEYLISSLVVKTRGRYEMTNKVQIGILDGASAYTGRLHFYIPALVFTGSRYAQQSINEWYWAGLSAVQVALCRQLCWQRMAEDIGHRSIMSYKDAFDVDDSMLSSESMKPIEHSSGAVISGYKLFECAGVDLRLASVICYWNNSDWLQAPVNYTLSKMPLNELLSIIDVTNWNEEHIPKDKLSVVRCQLRPGAPQEWKYDAGNSCLPFLQKVVSSEVVRNIVMKRLTWYAEHQLLSFAEKNEHPFVVSALVRHRLYRYGLSLLSDCKREETMLVRRIPPRLQFIYGATSEQVLAPCRNTMKSNVCFVNASTATCSMVVKLPLTNGCNAYTTAAKGIKGRDFALICFKVQQHHHHHHSVAAPETFYIAEELCDAVVHVRLAEHFSTAAAVDLIRQTPAGSPWQHVWIMDSSSQEYVINKRSVRPYIKWYLRRFLMPRY